MSKEEALSQESDVHILDRRKAIRQAILALQKEYDRLGAEIKRRGEEKEEVWWDDDTDLLYAGDLLMRTRLALRRAGFRTVGDLRPVAEELCRGDGIRNVGNVGWRDVYKMLGLEWKWKDPK